jgi:hypothetical protein
LELYHCVSLYFEHSFSLLNFAATFVNNLLIGILWRFKLQKSASYFGYLSKEIIFYFNIWNVNQRIIWKAIQWKRKLFSNRLQCLKPTIKWELKWNKVHGTPSYNKPRNQAPPDSIERAYHLPSNLNQPLKFLLIHLRHPKWKLISSLDKHTYNFRCWSNFVLLPNLGRLESIVTVEFTKLILIYWIKLFKSTSFHTF